MAGKLHAVALTLALEAFIVTRVVGVGELTAEDCVLAAAAPDAVLTAALVAAAVAAAGVLEAGVNEGVVAVQASQIVTVSVVRNVETLVTTISDVLPPLPLVVVVTGQLVTVV